MKFIWRRLQGEKIIAEYKDCRFKILVETEFTDLKAFDAYIVYLQNIRKVWGNINGLSEARFNERIARRRTPKRKDSDTD